MTEKMVTVPTALMQTLLANLVFQGHSHGKFVSAAEADNFNGDLGQKMREYLDDSDTTCIAVTMDGTLLVMPHTWSFDDARGDGETIIFAFTVPTALLSWTSYGSLPPVDKRYVQEVSA